MDQLTVNTERILIVGTEDTLSNPVIDLLKKAGHSLVITPDLASAQAMVSEGYSLLIADARMLKLTDETPTEPGCDLKSRPIKTDTPLNYSEDLPVKTFLKLAIENITGSLSDLQNLALSLSDVDAQQSVCHLLDCPRLNKLTSAILESIDVLERTKGSFKSKELGDLRKKLKMIVQDR